MNVNTLTADYRGGSALERLRPWRRPGTPAYGSGRLAAQQPGRGLRAYDRVLLLAVALLCAVGALLVWSATRTELAAEGANPQTYLIKHLLNAGLGAVLLMLTARLDSRLL